jgi:DNA polymerase III epsilon subunit family exonuclease
MRTEVGSGELERVPDAAAPDGEAWRGDVQLEGGLPVEREGVASPEEAERNCAAAAAAAARHLERHARRVRRGRGPRGDWADLALADLRVCALDLETTGGTHDDAIVEVGCVQLSGALRGREFATLVQPPRPVSRAAFAVHGIAPEQLAAAPAIASVLPYVDELTRDRVVVAHNAPFDIGFLERACGDAGRAPLGRPVIDTVLLSRALLGGRCGLGSVAQRLGIDAPHVHRALPDARLAALVWLVLASVLASCGATRLGEVPGAGSQAPSLQLPPPRRTPESRLAARLASASRSGAALHVVVRSQPGAAALALRVRIVRPIGSQWMAVDLDRDASIVLDPDRIDCA